VLKQGPDDHNVVASPRRGWDIRRDRAKRTYRHFWTKPETVVRGGEVGRNQKIRPRIEHHNGRTGHSGSHCNIKDEQEAAGP
jgi:hypothetical protein